jgi:hypothetical protein
MHHVRGTVSKDFGAFAFDSCAADAWWLTQQFMSEFPGTFTVSPAPLVLYYGTTQWTHPWFRDFSDNAFPIGISPLFVRSATNFCTVSQSGATTSNHGLRVPHLSKRRRDRGQRFSVSERSSERHKVICSQFVRVLLGISAREQAGVTTDLGQDPTLVCRLRCLPP